MKRRCTFDSDRKYSASEAKSDPWLLRDNPEARLRHELKGGFYQKKWYMESPVNPTHRRQGHGSRLMHELAKIISMWLVGSLLSIASILYSDIAKVYYSKRGWPAFHREQSH